MNIGLLVSVPSTLKAFFIDWIGEWVLDGNAVFTASGPGDFSSITVGHSHSSISSLRRSPTPDIFRATRQIESWARDNHLDVILTNTATASFASRARNIRIPVVYFCHGLHWNAHNSLKSLPFKLGEILALRNTSGVIVMNSDDESWMSRFKGLPLIKLKHGVGLDIQRFPHAALPDSSNKLQLLWIGEMSQRKRPLDLVPLSGHLQSSNLPFEINVLGTGDLSQKLHDSIGEFPIILHGNQNPYPFLRDSHLLVSTSEWEGLARVGLEALATGRRTVGYDVKGVRDIQDCIVNGRPGDLGELSESIRNWWQNPTTPQVNRSDLDWKTAFNAVTNFVTDVTYANKMIG